MQKPWWLIQGKRFQEGLLLGLLVAAAVAQHPGVALVLCRSGHASCASRPAEGEGAEWREVPPLWEVEVQQVPPLWEVKVQQMPPLLEV